ncbi:hypothetical protein BFP72_15040 [Reichenbachiella sp. 5M10]|uniref:SRPBCC domain-containing protein n=1 Tax=Reichenbachiella sp. 5M10 TaxID=1889772 RepID=UPI000C1626F4|nr:SRPBCC domain-containing protein [Reichenbachiella sp. 5M10]PIB36621.1 hypothetical protein BFP72_15040 [Reichenbachiella sp. 5M10]
MKEIRTEILIAAPIEVLWRVFIDFESYSDWNSIMTVSGELAVGHRLKLTVNLNGKVSSFRPKLTVIEDQRQVEWVGNLGHRRIFSGNHYFHFLPEGEGQTRFVHGERFSGVFSRGILKKVMDPTEEAFHKFNASLKEYAEDLVI